MLIDTNGNKYNTGVREVNVLEEARDVYVGTQRVTLCCQIAQSILSDRGTREEIAFALTTLNSSYLYQQFPILSHSVSSRKSKERNLNRKKQTEV